MISSDRDYHQKVSLVNESVSVSVSVSLLLIETLLKYEFPNWDVDLTTEGPGIHQLFD